MKVTFAEIKSVCTNISPVVYKALTKVIYVRDIQDSEFILHDVAMCFFTCDILLHSKLLKNDEVIFVITEIIEKLMEHGDLINTAMITTPAKIPDVKLGILDRQIVIIDGYPKFINFRDATITDEIPLIPLETILYNLTRTFMLYSKKLENKILNVG